VYTFIVGEVAEIEKLRLEIPREVVEAVKLPLGEVEKELRKELALALYQRGVLSLGKARALAQMIRDPDSPGHYESVCSA